MGGRIGPRSGVLAALVLSTLAGCGGDSESGASASGDCGTYKVAVVDDDARRAAFYAIENGDVSSDVLPDVEISYLQIPALIQATGTDQYNLGETSTIGMAKALAGGVELRAAALLSANTGGGVAMYTAADSDVQSPGDLEGRTIGVTSFGSNATLLTRMVLADQYGLDTALQGGDVKFVELDPSQLVTSVERGQVDAADLFHLAGWSAEKDGGLRKLQQTDAEFHDTTGAWLVGSALVVTQDELDAGPECVAAFQELLAESVAYTRDNIETVAEAVSAETGVEQEFIEYWWTSGAYDFGGTLDQEWQDWTQTLWDSAAEYGEIPESPELSELVVESGRK